LENFSSIFPIVGKLLVLTVFVAAGARGASDVNLKTAYRNYWFSPSPEGGPYEDYFGDWPKPARTNASTPLYHGHALGDTNAVAPTDGRVTLRRSAFGQPVEGLKPDFPLGSVIEPPAGADTNLPPANFVPRRAGNNTNAYYECTDPVGGAFWAPSTRQVIAAQPNNVEIHWRMLDGSTNVQVVMIGAVPYKRPARLFWTESPYDAPTVNLQGLFPVLHYNSEVPPPVYDVTTNVNGSLTNVTSNVVSGVWLDGQKALHGIDVRGMFILEYYSEGSYSEQVQPCGIEIVQVLEPEITTMEADIGSRLLPRDTYWSRVDGDEGVYPQVQEGLNDTVFVNTQTGPKENWAYAIRKTVEEPWALEIYWEHLGLMNVRWPYEVDWYSCDWPAHPQIYVIADSTQHRAEVVVPAGLSAQLMPDMEPPLHAHLSSSGRSFYTDEPGVSLLKYTTDHDIWFEVVQSVLHDDPTFFDLDVYDATIGEELRPPAEQAHALALDGQGDFVQIAENWLYQVADWSLAMWFFPDSVTGGVLYAEGNPDMTFSISLTNDGAVAVSAYNPDDTGSNWVHLVSATGTVTTSGWHYLSATLAGGTDSNGTFSLYLDNQAVFTSNAFHRIGRHAGGIGKQSALGACAPTAESAANFLRGRMDQVRIWSTALSQDALWSNRYETATTATNNLLADFPFIEGAGEIVHNARGGKNGSIYGNPRWTYGQVEPGADYATYPGYIYTPYGTRYNIDRYDYPTEADPDADSYVFPVNEGGLEVWWANRSTQSGMPAVYYPSYVSRYACDWPTNAPEIVIASGKGGNSDQIGQTTNALLFNGVSGEVVVSNRTVLDFGNEMTLEAFVNLLDSAASQDIVSMMTVGAGEAGFEFGMRGGRFHAAIVGTDNNSVSLDWGQANDALNQWTHVAVTYSAGGELRGYVNGRLVAQTNAGEAIKFSTNNMVFGQAVCGVTNLLNGSLAELRLWNAERSEQAVENQWLSRPTGRETDLIAYYPFTETTNSALLADLTTNALDGDIIAGCTWQQPGRPVPVSSSYMLSDDSIYVQNYASADGYNPNEEHAIVLGGVVYALRDDLNVATSSAPFVLVDYLDPQSARPKMMLFGVTRTNIEYGFEYPLEAGLPILPPMPLGAMPLCADTYSHTQPPAWRDRKLEWWARSAGDDGGEARATMHFYYQMQPTFQFPELSAAEQPPIGQELPWLPTPPLDHGTRGTPVPVYYDITWPDNVPEMRIAQTLTEAYQGLPDIWDQLSVDIIYQQSQRNGKGDSVTVFDPVVAHGAPLAASAVDKLVDSERAVQDLTDDKIHFPDLPPSIYPRIYYDPDRGADGELMLEGVRVETLTGGGYLLLNCLADHEKAQTRAIADGTDASSDWNTAVNALSNAVTLIHSNRPYVNAALYAGLGRGHGYVTVALNNSTNEHQVPSALPVSLEILKVIPELYSGELEPIEPEDALDEQLSLRASPDFAGRVDDFRFQWRWVEPEGGLIPNTNFAAWNVYGVDNIAGSNEVTISGASPFTLRDNYFAVRFRSTRPDSATGTNWSDWVYSLAPGWVQRVMNGINPFEQCFEDKVANAVDTRSTMIQMVGPPYEGDVALNEQAACDGGLIPLYQTVLNRAADFSINAGLSDAGNNDALLYAASRLHDLYMLLGNEAYADAQDPTIAFPRALYEDERGAEATSIFCFMNQLPNLLAEELALLRGRDDTLEPSTHTSPIYNRLIWNFTAGINGGEAAYAYNYNIRGAPTTTVGVISAEDAKRLYPQGHGDAWGHYLSALSGYYTLLSNTNFVWQTEPGATLVGNATVSVDYFDEQKFAEAAAARARTGIEIINRTWREAYSEEPTARWAGYRDGNTNRAWGLAGWGARAGQAALFDWVTANSLLLDNLTNLVQVGGSNTPPEGIQKIDRTTVPELQELAGSVRNIQRQLDQADGGMNPLGLVDDVVPFDISPAEIDEGKTHFEQVYDRALQALYNSCVAFDYARNTTRKIREQFDSVYDLREQLAENEIDFHNRLIGIFGYPYPDDIGPGGTYPQDYAGPDLVNWQIIDLEDLVYNAPTGQPMSLAIYNYVFEPGNDWTGDKYSDYTTLPATLNIESNLVGTTTVYMADNGLKVKPPTWSGRRSAQGELQLALADYIQTWYALDAKRAEYDRAMYELEVELLHRQADYTRYPGEWGAAVTNLDRIKQTSRIVEGLKVSSELVKITASGIAEIGVYGAGLVPKEIGGVVGPFPVEEVNENVGASIKMAAASFKYAQFLSTHAMSAGIYGREGAQERWTAELEKLIADNTYQDVLHWSSLDTQAKLKNQFVKQAELMEQVEALEQSYQRIQKLLAEGQLLLNQRGQVRARAAQRIQMNRYADLSFRIFRDDALRRYNDAFDLAARYVYLAARAYDYETGLLSTDTTMTPGSEFLEQIVRARLPGRFYVWLGEPETGIDEGEPGLADIMARMKANWDVVKGRFGFNNPETETSRFSLRSECLRIAPSVVGDAAWAMALEGYRIDDLNELPEFVRYCIPFSTSTNIEPALVIPFSTMIEAGKNYFGHDLAGGDNAYDPSHAATKVRSAGVWFTGYDSAFNTNSSGGGMANEPRVYLVPVGEDVMRSPSGDGLDTRHWKVFDQAMPVPYSIGYTEMDDPDWMPLIHSLSEPLAKIRRFGSMRSYHDSGDFNEDETIGNSRLIGRSVWNTRWLLIIPGRTLLADPEEGIERFIHGALDNGTRDGNGVKDIKVFFQTYSIEGG
jgi:hypothetical protein